MNWGKLYLTLMSEPINLTLEQISYLTDEQILGLMDDGKMLRSTEASKRKAIESLSKDFKSDFLETVKSNLDTTDEEAEKLFNQSFPDFNFD